MSVPGCQEKCNLCEKVTVSEANKLQLLHRAYCIALLSQCARSRWRRIVEKALNLQVREFGSISNTAGN